MSRKDAMENMRQVLFRRRKEAMENMRQFLFRRRDALCKALAAESQELSRVERALERVRNGHFGICEGCGVDIPMAHLVALPYATYCIKCQREAEHKGH